MSYFLPVNVTILLSLLIFVFYLFGVYNLLGSFQENECQMTFMFQYPQFVEISLPLEVQKAYPKYGLYGYGEGGITEKLRKMKFKGIPVLFIPGSSGSYKQGRSLASISLRKSLDSRTPFHFNYFMIDYNEEQAAFFGGVLEEQRGFAAYCIKKVLTLYQNSDMDNKPDSVILIGHSFGGLIAKGVFMAPDFDYKLVRLIISLTAPHKYPIIQFDHYVTSYYKNLGDFWKNNSDLRHISLMSVGGGPRDLIVHSDVIDDVHSVVNVLTTSVPGVWIPNDHLSIMWCKQFILTIIRALFDCVDLSTKQLSTDKEHINSVLSYHFLKRSAGKRFSGSITPRFASFEKSSNWFENLQRRFTVTQPRGLVTSHYIMIRLFSDSKSDAAFIEAYNLNVRDWVFVCTADLVYNSIRMCESGENLSNMTEIAPVDTNLKLKRKFVYLNLAELKEKSFTHVIIRLPRSDSYMSVNVDVHQPSDRNINYQVPKFYSLSSETVIPSTQNNSGYYSINFMGFEYVWQSYTLKTEVLSCKMAKNHAVVSFTIPWSNKDQHFIFMSQDSLSVSLSLISPKPNNFNETSHPSVRFHFDPSCTYRVSIRPSIIGMFTQGARFYSAMLPAFLAAVGILALRQQMHHLWEGNCALFQSALSVAVRRYYIILQATILGSKLLGLGFFLHFLPVPDFSTLQELSLDSFFLTILLYGVAIIVVYIAGGAIYVAVVLSGQAAHKMALKFVAKAISGFFNWSEWVISALHQVPFFVVVILISLSLSTSGAVAIWLGAFFYFLKLCKMYDEYLEDWFDDSIKLIAKKVKDLVTGKSKATNKEERGRAEENVIALEDKTVPEGNSGRSSLGETDATFSEEVDLLSQIHFHVTVFLIWILIALLYVPCLLMWAKNYHFNFFLEKDPALMPSIVVSLCGAVLWQPGVPRPCRKFHQATSSILFLLAVVCIIYGTLSLYRLGFAASASLAIVSLNQVTAKFRRLDIWTSVSYWGWQWHAPIVVKINKKIILRTN